MKATTSQFLGGLASLNVARVRFSITRNCRACCHTAPQVAYEEEPPLLRPVDVCSVTALFDAFGLSPLQGTYTLYVAEGMLCYDPPGARRSVRNGRAQSEILMPLRR